MNRLHSVIRSKAGNPGDSGSAGSAPGEAFLDLSVALDRVGGDAELLKELTALFIDDYPRQLRLIEAAVSANDCRTAEREAHGLKGAVANFGANGAMEAARLLEMAAREGRQSDLPALLTEVVRQMAGVRSELDRFAAS